MKGRPLVQNRQKEGRYILSAERETDAGTGGTPRGSALLFAVCRGMIYSLRHAGGAEAEASPPEAGKEPLMSEVIRRELFPGVWLRAVHTEKFKSSYLSLTLMAPLDPETASANALVPQSTISETMRILISNGIILYALTKAGGGSRG